MCLLTASRASAQNAPGDGTGETGRFRFGPLRFTPTILVTDVGTDTNVFNNPDDPQQDSTAAIGPSVALWMKAGPARLSGKTTGQYLYYDRFENQRAFNTVNELKFEVPMARFTPFVTGNYANTKNRAGYEIDSRARMLSENIGVGGDVRLSGKTDVVLASGRTRVKYADEETFRGVDLGTALNHATNWEQLQFRHKLTSLTTLVVSAEAIQDRFDLDPLRSSNSLKILPGFELKPSALISGTVFVGYRRFEPLNVSVPAYQGPVASVDARFAHDSRQFAFKVSRDLTYSLEALYPYYALTDAGVAVTQRITYTWDVMLRASWQRLDYQQLHALAPAGTRVDTGRQYGAGFGYRIGRALRVGLDASYYQRQSPAVQLRDFEGFRIGASVSYGSPQ